MEGQIQLRELLQVDLEFYYQYGTLNDQPANAIRLLTVNTGSSDSIECTMSTASLDEKPRYVALSYMWGTQDASKEIVINHKRFAVRPNLWECLKRFQRQPYPSRIWIDAICVNQENIPERNQQVRLMGRIYRQATIVIAWLGDDATVRAVEAAFECDYFRKAPILRFVSLMSKSKRTALAKMYAGLSVLTSRDYWNRAWIVQELCLASDVLVWFARDGQQSLQFLQAS